MGSQRQILDDELPELKTIILPRNERTRVEPLRRSPRKKAGMDGNQLNALQLNVSASSSQQRLSPAKQSPSKRSPLKTLPQARAPASLSAGIPFLPRNPLQTSKTSTNGSIQLTGTTLLLAQGNEAKDDCLPTSKVEISTRKWTTTTSIQTAKNESHSAKSAVKTSRAQRENRFVLDEARCNEDLVDSDAQDEGEEDETDLSGFIVDDDAELSYHDSSEVADTDGEEERHARRKVRDDKPRRRLQRGRRNVADSDNDSDDHDELANSMKNMSLNKEAGEHRQRKDVEVIDLLSPEPQIPVQQLLDPFASSRSDGINLFEKFKALKLSPPRSSQSSESVPSKHKSMTEPTLAETTGDDRSEARKGFATPPTTPPASPSKLKSPSKLLSPSKRGDGAQRSPHRPSMDAFWDLNEVNEWNDQFSPKKAPLTSPRKNRLFDFDIWSEDDNDANENSFETKDDTSDSLPSPCVSPSKSKSKLASPAKAEQQRLLVERRARQLEKKAFEQTKEQMAKDLLLALDTNVTGSRISELSATTGGVQIVWSKTLRSTAGRANWRRTVSKPTGSPVKGKSEESAPGTITKHFANIELAIKVIDRKDRLINTLAHEFCHLANFMVSNVRDQPHGASFQNWARKVTIWMKKQDQMPDWKGVEVTTKHGYVIEWKYLWICVGRPEPNAATKFLNIEDSDVEDEGCGAEYGRHSKSIDTDTQRCGRCKGRLVQVRPKPRASPTKKSTATITTTAQRGLRSGTRKVSNGKGKGVSILEKMVEVVELSD